MMVFTNGSKCSQAYIQTYPLLKYRCIILGLPVKTFFYSSDGTKSIIISYLYDIYIHVLLPIIYDTQILYMFP
jgi:hypothetical protein